MPVFLFYFFSFVAVVGALGVIACRNPVSSAFSLVACFLGVAALFVGLNAYFVGIIQILVYAGAIMVLFLFIIMLLDLREEESKTFRPPTVAAAALVATAFLGLKILILKSFVEGEAGPPALAEGLGSDVKAIGKVLFTEYNFHLQIMGVLLLVATVGVVVLSKRELN